MPNMHCGHCLKLHYDAGHTPDCWRDTGCPVGEDLATDEEVSRFIQRFKTAKALFWASQDPNVQQGIFRELGLYDDPEFHLALEDCYARWRQKVTESSKAQKAPKLVQKF